MILMKSSRLFFSLSERKKITETAAMVVSVEANTARKTLLFRLMRIWSIMTMLLSMINPREIVMAAIE